MATTLYWKILPKGELSPEHALTEYLVQFRDAGGTEEQGEDEAADREAAKMSIAVFDRVYELLHPKPSIDELNAFFCSLVRNYWVALPKYLRSNYGCTGRTATELPPLFHAVRNNHVRASRWLIDTMGESVKEISTNENKQGESVLGYACDCASGSAKWLLSNYPESAQVVHPNGNTIWHEIAANPSMCVPWDALVGVAPALSVANTNGVTAEQALQAANLLHHVKKTDT
eukprot:TRINITY_DN105235_c0_g1_i1.p1 TRINITY_DN105235_c0_g1~~TRINITY_DN105235_c0_g1_i1.p1  ORF type:complete len:250 (+),score=9.79 TRINITY_DN105235_c0_g1_i1:62-751(+)